MQIQFLAIAFHQIGTNLREFLDRSAPEPSGAVMNLRYITCYLFPVAACWISSHHQSPDFWKVATISANGDAGIGKMVADAFEKVGKQGTITVAEAGRCWCVTGGSFKKILHPQKWGVVQT